MTLVQGSYDPFLASKLSQFDAGFLRTPGRALPPCPTLGTGRSTLNGAGPRRHRFAARMRPLRSDVCVYPRKRPDTGNQSVHTPPARSPT